MPEMVPCYCEKYRCCGTLQSHVTRRRHMKKENQELVVPQSVGDFDTCLNINSYGIIPEATTPLYPNAPLTILEAVFEIIRDFVMTPDASKKSTSNRLQTLKEKFLPENNLMPGSFDEAMRLIEPFLMPIERFHTCPNDCVIFRKEYTHLKSCPKCNAPRYKEDGKTAQRSFTYFPIAPRIRRMFATKAIHDLLTQHHREKRQPGKQDDVHASPMWKSFFADDGEFQGNPNGIVLNICLDGVNPFKSQKIDYSLWPIELSVLNLPPLLRKSIGGTFIAGIIPGNGSGEPKTLEPYMAMLVDELLALENCQMKDSNGDMINVSVKLLEFTLDYPAIGKVLHFPGSARSLRACMFCDITGETSKVCNKTIFLQNRRFLHPSHPLRMQHDGHVRSCTEEREIPSLKRTSSDTTKLREEFDRLPNENQRSRFTRKHGVKGCYNFMRLGYHKFEQHLGPDPMHTIKDALANMAKILNGKIKLDKLINSELEFEKNGANASASLSNEEVKRVDGRIKQLIFPRDATGCKESFLSSPGKLHPTHAWHEYGTKNIMIYLLRDCMKDKTRRSLLFWLSVLNRFQRYEVIEAEIDTLVEDTRLALALMERDFPVALFNITTHLLLHEPETLKRKGPAHSRWMFSFERLNSLISRRVKSRKHPEASAIRTIQLLDWIIDVILAKRLNIVNDEDSFNALETILFNATSQGNLISQNKRKRRALKELAEEQKSEIARRLQKETLENDMVNSVNWYKSARPNNLGVVTFQTRGSKSDTDYTSCSRYIYVKSKNAFGEIMSIYEHFEEERENVWFVVDIFVTHEVDFETRLPKADRYSERQRVIFTVDEISDPLIVGIDDAYIWFISVDHDSKFLWMCDHV